MSREALLERRPNGAAANPQAFLLRHYSANGIIAYLRSTPQVGANEHVEGWGCAMKPSGLWLSCDDFETNWRDWCEGERFQLEELARATVVRLRADANVLLVTSAAELDEFVERFGYIPDMFNGLPHRDEDFHRRHDTYIDWRRVSEQWQGIIIAPYLWERRLGGPMWYYSWDCASGCVWDATAVEAARFEAGQPALLFPATRWSREVRAVVPAMRWTREVRFGVDRAGFWVCAEHGDEQRVAGWSTWYRGFYAHDAVGSLRRRAETRTRHRPRRSLMMTVFPRRGRRWNFSRAWMWEREGHVVHDSSTWVGGGDD